MTFYDPNSEYYPDGTLKLNMKDYRILESAILSWKSGFYDLIKIECFNEAEAKAYREYLEQSCPGIKLSFSWLNFTKKEVLEEKL